MAAKLKVLANDADTLNGPEWTEALIRGAAADAERLAMTGGAAGCRALAKIGPDFPPRADTETKRAPEFPRKPLF